MCDKSVEFFLTWQKWKAGGAVFSDFHAAEQIAVQQAQIGLTGNAAEKSENKSFIPDGKVAQNRPGFFVQYINIALQFVLGNRQFVKKHFPGKRIYGILSKA